MKEEKLSYLYITKMLICAWKLKNQDYELAAYQLIGLHFYYNGDVKKAILFHKKNIEG